MAFASPMFLIALLLPAAPVVLHRLTRGASTRILLPTFVFLARAGSRQSRLFRTRHRALLLLRCAALVFLVLGFARPELPAPMAETSGAAGANVTVLDASMSMTCSDGGVTAFERGRALTLRTVDGLARNVRASVVLAGASPRVLGGAGDRFDLEQRLRDARPAPERCAVGPALAAAGDLLRSGGGLGTLTIVSDFQRAGWADADLSSVPAGTRVLYLPVAGPERENAAVTAIRVRPERPRPGETAAIEVEVWNGRGSAQGIPVTVSVNGVAVGSAAARAAAWSSDVVSIPYTCAGASPVEVTASIPRDDLPADDTRSLVLAPGRGPRVGLLTGEPDVRASGSYYLARALSPSRGSAGSVEVESLGTNPSAAALARCDAVALCGSPVWTTALAARLAGYARKGGALIAVPTDAADVERFAMIDRAQGGPVLPCLPLQRVDVRRRGRGFVALSEARLQSPSLRVFRDRAGVDLARVHAWIYFVTTEPLEGAETLLRYEDGTPALVRRPFGAGQVVLWNVPLSPGQGDLARRTVFVPLLHEVLRAVCAPSDAAAAYICGEPAAVPLAVHARVAGVSGPSGEPVPSVVDRQGGVVSVRGLPSPGVYTVRVPGARDQRFAANVPPEESDLRAIDPAMLGRPRGGRSVTAAGQSGAQLEYLREPAELWPWMLVSFLACLLAEEWVRGWRARAGAPGSVR